MDKNKENEFGILRAFGVLAVIANHVTSVYGNFNRESFSYMFFGVINKFCKFAVPLFLFLSVALLIITTMKKGKLNVLEFYKKRFLKTLPAYIICVFVYYGYLKFNNFELINFIEEPREFFILYILQGAIYYHLYFMPLIFQLYIIFPIIYFVAINLRKIKMNINISFILYLVSLIALQYIYRQIHKYYIWPHFQNPAIIVFDYTLTIGMGTWIGINYEKIKKSYMVQCISLMLAIILGYILIRYSLFTNISIPNLISPIYTTMTSIVLLYFARYIAEKYNNLRPTLCKIGEHSFNIYLIHPIILNETRSYLSNASFFDKYTQNKVILLFLIFIITLSGTYLVSVCIRLIKKYLVQLLKLNNNI